KSAREATRFARGELAKGILTEENPARRQGGHMGYRRANAGLSALVLGLASWACLLKPHVGPAHPPGPLGAVTTAERLGYVHHSQVWHRTDVSSMDLARGPQGPKSFEPFQTITCDYVQAPRRGTTPKFHCALAPDDVVKVKYGNTEG